MMFWTYGGMIMMVVNMALSFYGMYGYDVAHTKYEENNVTYSNGM